MPWVKKISAKWGKKWSGREKGRMKTSLPKHNGVSIKRKFPTTHYLGGSSTIAAPCLVNQTLSAGLVLGRRNDLRLRCVKRSEEKHDLLLYKAKLHIVQAHSRQNCAVSFGFTNLCVLEAQGWCQGGNLIEYLEQIEFLNTTLFSFLPFFILENLKC